MQRCGAQGLRGGALKAYRFEGVSGRAERHMLITGCSEDGQIVDLDPQVGSRMLAVFGGVSFGHATCISEDI